MQSFRNDARRETHNEVCLFCRGFRHVICPIITFIISFQREKVLEMFHHAYNSYMVSKLLSQRFAHKQELHKCSILTFIDRYGSKDLNTLKFNEVSWGKESGIIKNSNSVVVFMRLILNKSCTYKC